jgi:rSAM/selenodomain-associated transferase 2
VLRVTVVIPARDEAAGIAHTLIPLQPWRGPDCELLLVDGGSRDATLAVARPLVDRVLEAGPGRAAQMNAGARAATGDLLWFLHADTRPAPGALQALREVLGNSGWGYFRVRLDGRHPLLRLIETTMNARARLTGIATGDQGIFLRRDLFERVGGYPAIALMEDVALSAALRRHGPPVCVANPLVTSSRRWERNGILRTVGLMWWLRLAYRCGVAPERLARWYSAA